MRLTCSTTFRVAAKVLFLIHRPGLVKADVTDVIKNALV